MDFAITQSGDLVLEESIPKNQFSATYRVSEDRGLNVSFHVLNETEYPENKGLLVTFVQDEKSDLTEHAKVISSIEEKIQLIRIALMTELDHLPRKKGFGSLLIKQKHQDIHDPTNLSVIKNEVQSVVSGFLENPSVVVKPKTGTGHLYFHNVEIKIYENNLQIFKFYI